MSVIAAKGLLLMAVSAMAQAPGSIAYLSVRDGFWQICVMAADGTQGRQITRSVGDKTRVSWYPDGERLLVNGSDGRAYRVSLQTGEETAVPIELRGFQDAVLSYDGKSIAFSLSTSGSVDDHNIWLVDESGTNPRKLTSMQWLQHEPAWSMDGRYIYYLSGHGDQVHDIWRVGTSGQPAQQLTNNQLYHFDVAVARDESLAFSSNRTGNYELWIRSPDGKDRQITHDAALDARPAWTSDAKQLLFESSYGGTLGIWSIDLASGQRVRLTPASVPSRFPVVFDPVTSP